MNRNEQKLLTQHFGNLGQTIYNAACRVKSPLVAKDDKQKELNSLLKKWTLKN